MKWKQKIENIVKKLNTRKGKNIIYVSLALAVVLVFGYRFYVVARESRFQVFNIARNNLNNGTPVETLRMEFTNGTLYEPLTIKRNTAYVSGARVDVFKVGQKSGNCKIVSVSKKIDLDTGMHVIKTTGCEDGLQYIEKEKIGFYVPTYAVVGKGVYVVNNGVAEFREVVILDRDNQNVLIKYGVEKGDIVILSKVKNNEKVKIAQ
jgi:hypothetical protein